MPFQVQYRMCDTCIYRKKSGFDVKALEAEIADPFMEGMFNGHRTCHHSDNVCCHGFWQRHKDHFAVGQVAQRLAKVQLVHVDNLKEK